jgi:hypothetical protein
LARYIVKPHFSKSAALAHSHKKPGFGLTKLIRIHSPGCPTLFAADGRGRSAPPEGILSRWRIRFLGFFRQIPRPPLKPAVGPPILSAVNDLPILNTCEKQLGRE